MRSVDRTRFFVFDAAARKVVYEQDTGTQFGATTSQQGPRVLIQDDNGAIYILFVKGVGRIDLETHQVTMLAMSPVPIGPGGDFLNGRIYFGSGSHVYSYSVPD